MTNRHQRDGPRFLWTGLMILIPVLALGAVGLWQLRQDRAAALSGARKAAEKVMGEVLERARLRAQGFLPIMLGDEDISRVWPQFSFWDNDGYTMRFSADGELVDPKPIPQIPVPTIEPTPEAKALDQLLGDSSLALTEKITALVALAEESGESKTTAGFSVKQLALRQALHLGKDADTDIYELRDWASFLISEAISQPSILSEQLISEGEKFIVNPEADSWFKYNQYWNRGQATRKFYQRHSHELRQLLRAEGATDTWLRSDPNFFCRIYRYPEVIFLDVFPIESISEKAAAYFGGEALRERELPDHLGVQIHLDGRLVYTQAEQPMTEILAAAADPGSKVRAEIVFTDRDAFLQPVRQRSVRTGWLIALAVLAAGMGWFAAWRAFVRQQQLAAMKDNFVSAVSHELKAPIASIGLMAEELGAGSEKRVEYTKLIAGECARLGSLVENVLDYARIESGSDEFHFEEADIGELVRAAADLMRPPAAERDIEIKVEAPPAGELCATVDARAIGRALVNLLDNAIKYSPAKKPITISAAGDQITVGDCGTPISTAEGAHIFERFYRSGSELTRENKGVGIGLSLVRHIAIAHKGKAWVASDKTGNQFHIRIGKTNFQPAQ